MHTVEMLECALDFANHAGYGIRHEWLDGASSGRCEIAGQKWLFVDLALSPIEQLDQVLEALRSDPDIGAVKAPGELQRALGIRPAA